MSDINTSLSSSAVFTARQPTSTEARRDASRVEDVPLDTPTNEAANAAAQVAPAEEGDTGNRSSNGGRDPLERAAEQLQSLIPEGELSNTSLSIELDELSGRFIYQSIDNESGEVVRQFPPEELLRLLSIVRDAEGIAVDEQA